MQTLRARPYQVAVILLLAGFLISRLVYLENFPVFVDEAMHIRWGMDALTGNGWENAFAYGKYLSVILWLPFLSMPVDLLLAARLACVIAGAATLLVVIRVGDDLFSQPVGLIAGVIFTIIPFALFYNRMALTDNFQLMFTALVYWSCVRLVTYPAKRGGLVLLSASLLGLILSKISGAVLLPLPILAVLLIAPRQDKRTLVVKAIFAVSMTFVVLIVLYMSGFGRFERGLRIASLIPDFTLILDIVGNYWILLTPPLALLAVYAVLQTGCTSERGRWLIVGLLFVIVLFVMAGRTVSRYYVITLIPLSLILAKSALNLWNGGWLSQIAVAAAMIFPIGASAVIVFSPVNAWLPVEARRQYIEGWSSGYGVDELAAFLKTADDGSVLFYSPDLIWSPAESFAVKASTASLRIYSGEQYPDLPDQEVGEVWIIRNYGRDVSGESEDLRRWLTTSELIWTYERPNGVTRLEVWAAR